MNGAVWVVAVLAMLTGSVMASAAGPPARPVFVAVVAGATAIQVMISRRLAAEIEDGGARVRRRRLDLLMWAIGIRSMQALTGGAGGLTQPVPGDRETLVSLLIMLAVRSAANATVDDLDAVERGLERADGTDPVARIRGRVLFYLVAVTAAAGFAGIRSAGLFDLSRPAATDMHWAPLAFLAIGLVALARSAYRAEAGRWRRDGAAVDVRTEASWHREALVVTALVMVVGAAVWMGQVGGSTLAVSGVARAGPVGAWIAERLEALGGGESDSATQRGSGGAETAPAFDLDPDAGPEWMGEVMFWLIAAGVLAWVATKGRQMTGRERRPTREGEAPGLRRVLVALIGLTVALWRALRRALAWAQRRVRASANTERARAPAVVSQIWTSEDAVRARIAAGYRRLVTMVSVTVGGRRRSETPREFAVRAGAALTDDEAVLDSVTQAYEEARFSDHVIAEDVAVRVERAVDEVERRTGPIEKGR